MRAGGGRYILGEVVRSAGFGPERAEHRDGELLDAATDVADKPYRVVVCPVEVIEGEEHGSGCTCFFQPAHHPIKARQTGVGAVDIAHLADRLGATEHACGAV